MEVEVASGQVQPINVAKPETQSNIVNAPAPRQMPFRPTPMPTFAVNIHSSYREKWTPVFEQLKDQYRLYCEGFLAHMTKKNNISPNLIYTLDNLKNTAYARKHPQQIEEMEVIAELSGLPFNHVVYVNFAYEILCSQKACCTIICRDKNGQILSGRNFDYYMMEEFSNISIQFDYFDEFGKMKYSTGAYVGLLMTHSAIRYGKYVLSTNQRTRGTYNDTVNQIENLGTMSCLSLIGELVKNCETYDEVVEAYKTTPMSAAIYLIAAGIDGNEGCVVERERNSVHKVYSLNENNWFLVVTNCDQEDADPDSRRDAAINKLQNIGRQNISMDRLFGQILSQYPDFHRLTISTCMMDANKNVFQQCAWYSWKPDLIA